MYSAFSSLDCLYRYLSRKGHKRRNLSKGKQPSWTRTQVAQQPAECPAAQCPEAVSPGYLHKAIMEDLPLRRILLEAASHDFSSCYAGPPLSTLVVVDLSRCGLGEGKGTLVLHHFL